MKVSNFDFQDLVMGNTQTKITFKLKWKCYKTSDVNTFQGELIILEKNTPNQAELYFWAFGFENYSHNFFILPGIFVKNDESELSGRFSEQVKSPDLA